MSISYASRIIVAVEDDRCPERSAIDPDKIDFPDVFDHVLSPRYHPSLQQAISRTIMANASHSTLELPADCVVWISQYHIVAEALERTSSMG